MAGTKKKRVVLTLQEKIDAIGKLDRGTPAYRIAEELGVGKTQIQSLRKRKAELLEAYEKNAPPTSKRRRYTTGNEEINELTLAWFKDAVSRRVNITGPLLQEKAIDFAQKLGKTDFKASKGWLESFKQRHNITYGTMSGERGDVDVSSVKDWKDKIQFICEGYEAKDILNLDETGLFYRDTSRQTFHFKGDDCAGGKRSKERMTVLLCASATGEKFKPLVIGKTKSPRCFKNINIDSLPVHYYYNKKAWMNSFIFEDYLKKLNKQMKREKRNILLFIDNAPSHPNLQFSNITVKFLPPNTTAYTQPMDQGIIQATKLKFRKRQLNHMMKEMDRQPTVSGPDILKQLNILDAIYWISNSWKEVETTTIQKCFVNAGFSKGESERLSDQNCDFNQQNDEETDEDDDIPLATLRLSFDLFGCAFKSLAEIDDNCHTCDTEVLDWNKPVSELSHMIRGSSQSDDDDDDDDYGDDDDDSCVSSQASHVPTLHQASELLCQLKAFALDKGHSNMLDHISQLEDEICTLMTSGIKQTKITDYFGDRSK